MRSYNRDYYMSTLSVIQEQRRLIVSLCDDMNMRLEELEEDFIMMFDQDEDASFATHLEETWGAMLLQQDALNDKVVDGPELDTMIQNAWQAGYDYSIWEGSKIVTKPKKYCTCDACWDDKSDTPDYRMD